VCQWVADRQPGALIRELPLIVGHILRLRSGDTARSKLCCPPSDHSREVLAFQMVPRDLRPSGSQSSRPRIQTVRPSLADVAVAICSRPHSLSSCASERKTRDTNGYGRSMVSSPELGIPRYPQVTEKGWKRFTRLRSWVRVPQRPPNSGREGERRDAGQRHGTSADKAQAGADGESGRGGTDGGLAFVSRWKPLAPNRW
jgi:hypothetical protein